MITRIDNDKTTLPNPDIVTFDFKYLIWDIDSTTGAVGVQEQIIPSHQCTDAELGIGQESTIGLYPTEKNSQKPLEFYKQKFFCPDTNDLGIRGEFNGNKAKLLGVSLNYCDERLSSTCIDPNSEEAKYFYTDHYMVILHNQSWFDMNEYGSKAIVKESKLTWVPVAPYFPETRH